MMIRLIVVAAVTLAISAGAVMAGADGYVYPDPLPSRMPPQSPPESSGVPTKHDLDRTFRDTGIYESHTSASPGIWLFQPNQLGGGNN
jgi:hypothetical protein